MANDVRGESEEPAKHRSAVFHAYRGVLRVPSCRKSPLEQESGDCVRYVHCGKNAMDQREFNVLQADDVILACVERQTQWEVLLTHDWLYYGRRSVLNILRRKRASWRAVRLSDLEVRVVQDRSPEGGFGIPFWISCKIRDEESELFSFFPRDPIQWLRQLQTRGVLVTDSCDVLEHPVRVWLRNHFEFVPMICLLPMMLIFVILQLVKFLTS
jgi:hypothetical protein